MSDHENQDFPNDVTRDVVAWRLGRVEKSLEDLRKDLRTLGEIKETVTTNQLRIASLEKSRDRQITAMVLLAIGVISFWLQEFLSLLAKVS